MNTTGDVETPAEVQPGLYDIDAELYHSDPIPGGSISSSGARKLVAECPAKFKYWLDNPQPHNKALELGTAAHKLVLDDGPELVLVDAEKWNTDALRAEVAAIRAAGDIPLKRDELEQVRAMAAALRQHEEAAALLEPGSGVAEQSAFWEDNGVWRRARFDWLRHDGQIVDYKTARSCRREDLEKAFNEHGYHQQQEWYIDAGDALNVSDPEKPFQFVLQEKEPPYLVVVTTCDPMARGIGRHLNEVALNTYAICRERDEWPGYLPNPMTALLSWVERQYA
ncbi:PD-(D/E)XK nuclease-like domain-containing protein [Streptomyces lancefieldiae]|uniref:PD-(D/E)XK nuclease-like domain-containing protein n=1 Tax=Streptomyces lancefieldiae TaxID=3075520 RepID=A0ABU3AI95_9ACTN|nr:PD-(D/E)XK nuclease-like domain-containing protein [Streptomyces sp. DSM 40712]MDT0608788.1 PD-(D/E)XK nuclease-like domain-containing protein [Streptomyces sp. DSM 40712]